MKKWLTVLLVLLWLPAVSQQAAPLKKNTVTLKFFGLSVHAQLSQNPEIYRNRLDAKGWLVPNYGGVIGYERFFYKDIFSVRTEQGFYADCAGLPAGFTHLGWRGRIFKTGNHSLNGGIGPTHNRRGQKHGYNPDPNEDW